MLGEVGRYAYAARTRATWAGKEDYIFNFSELVS